MKLKVYNCLFIRLKDGAWVEGARTWRHDQRSSSRCPHSEYFTSKWVIEVFLYLTYAANGHLLEFLINYWDHDLGMFDLQGEFLEATSEDVYFISSLSWRGALVNLEGTGRGADPQVYRTI